MHTAYQLGGPSAPLPFLRAAPRHFCFFVWNTQKGLMIVEASPCLFNGRAYTLIQRRIHAYSGGPTRCPSLWTHPRDFRGRMYLDQETSRDFPCPSAPTPAGAFKRRVVHLNVAFGQPPSYFLVQPERLKPTKKPTQTSYFQELAWQPAQLVNMTAGTQRGLSGDSAVTQTQGDSGCDSDLCSTRSQTLPYGGGSAATISSSRRDASRVALHIPHAPGRSNGRPHVHLYLYMYMYIYVYMS